MRLSLLLLVLLGGCSPIVVHEDAIITCWANDRVDADWMYCKRKPRFDGTTGDPSK